MRTKELSGEEANRYYKEHNMYNVNRELYPVYAVDEYNDGNYENKSGISPYSLLGSAFSEPDIICERMRIQSYAEAAIDKDDPVKSIEELRRMETQTAMGVFLENYDFDAAANNVYTSAERIENTKLCAAYISDYGQFMPEAIPDEYINLDNTPLDIDNISKHLSDNKYADYESWYKDLGSQFLGSDEVKHQIYDRYASDPNVTAEDLCKYAIKANMAEGFNEEIKGTGWVDNIDKDSVQYDAESKFKDVKNYFKDQYSLVLSGIEDEEEQRKAEDKLEKLDTMGSYLVYDGEVSVDNKRSQIDYKDKEGNWVINNDPTRQLFEEHEKQQVSEQQLEASVDNEKQQVSEQQLEASVDNDAPTNSVPKTAKITYSSNLDQQAYSARMVAKDYAENAHAASYGLGDPQVVPGDATSGPTNGLMANIKNMDHDAKIKALIAVQGGFATANTIDDLTEEDKEILKKAQTMTGYVKDDPNSRSTFLKTEFGLTDAEVDEVRKGINAAYGKNNKEALAEVNKTMEELRSVQFSKEDNEAEVRS